MGRSKRKRNKKNRPRRAPLAGLTTRRKGERKARGERGGGGGVRKRERGRAREREREAGGLDRNPISLLAEVFTGSRHSNWVSGGH